MRSIIIFFILLFFGEVCAQVTFFNNGQVVKVTNGGNIFINGNLTDDGTTANIINDGIIETVNDLYNGDFTIQNNATVEGSGEFRVEGDWINNATFISDFFINTSRVILTGNNQFITGTNVTTFYDLEMGNFNTLKTMTLNAIVTDSLILRNNELAAESNVLYFVNQDPGAISASITYGDEGYISTQLNGYLARLVNNISNYAFPMGSSVGTYRYRPVVMKPTTVTLDTFFVGMLNYDALTDGYYTDSLDTNLCLVNKDYYHAILRSNSTDADISIFYDPLTDIYAFDRLANWNNPLNQHWNLMPTSAPGIPVSGYTPVTELAWSNFTEKPYTLSAEKRIAPIITPPSFLCKGMDSVLFTASGSTEPYHWTFPVGVDIVSSQGNDSVYVNWGLVSGNVIVYGDTSGLCPSKNAFLLPGFSSNVIASFTTDTNILYADKPVQFIDQSTGGAVSWDWTFEEQLTSEIQNPKHVFVKPGEYNVILLVTDSLGCEDTASIRLSILEYFFVPNVFTPNGDGFNDQFMIPFAVGDGGTYLLQIYNRWGQLIFETTNYKLAWDGYNLNGELATSGTYYFVLTAFTPSKDYSTTGYLTLLR